jgi:cobalt-zinc-cadmium efflux system protein
VFDKALYDRYRRYHLAVVITLLVASAQFIVAKLFAESVALLADSLHSFSDMFVLVGVALLTKRELNGPKSNHRGIEDKFTRFAILLLVASALYVGYEGYERIVHPAVFHEWFVMATAGIAAMGSIFVHRVISNTDNSARDHKHKVSIAHVLADIAVSVIVFVSALSAKVFGTPALDGYGAILIAVWMLGYSIVLWRGTPDHHHNHDHHHPH